MTYDELMRSIETAAGERKEAVLAQAAAEAEKIRKSAVARADTIREEAMAGVKMRLVQEREAKDG